jgi:YbbR domain-containing protein
MSGSLTRLLTRNWPLKLAALALALMLYIAVAAQQPVTQTFSVRVTVLPPPGRALLEAPPGVSVVLSGRGSELLKLRSFPRTINLRVPDTLSASSWNLTLKASDIDIPKGADIQVADIAPREITVRLDSVARKDVKIVPRVKVVAESGYALLGGLAITPTMARIVGSDRALAAIDSVMTAPTEIANVTGSFTRTIPIDTTPLGVVRIAPKEIQVAGELTPIHERVFAGIPVESGAGALTGFVVTPPRVSVMVRGADAVVSRLTRDSLKVIVHLPGRTGTGSTYAHLTVIAPSGVVARASPDSVALRRKTGRG